MDATIIFPDLKVFLAHRLIAAKFKLHPSTILPLRLPLKRLHGVASNLKRRKIMNIGKFTKVGEGYTGTITLLQTEIGARLEPVTEKTSDKSPDFHFITKGRIGAAWKKKSKKDTEYLSIAVNDPVSLAFSCFLFKAEDGSYDLATRKAAKQ
jgi:uncharacterized protein (DUF736 family)